MITDFTVADFFVLSVVISPFFVFTYRKWFLHPLNTVMEINPLRCDLCTSPFF